MSWEDAFGEYDLDDLVGESEDDVGSLLEWGSDGLIYEGSLMSSLAPSESEAPMPVEPLVSAQDAFDRQVKSHWQMLPLSAETAEHAGELLSGLSDAELLEIPPTVLVHLQRTAAQGGMQVISPRQITLGGIAGRTNDSKRQPDMHIVGSNATRGLPWPVAAGFILSNLWHREPLDAYPNTPAVRSRTSSNQVVIRGDVKLDPVEMAVVKSRALIDMQRRPDIGGDADGLAEALAAAWGIDPESYYDVSGALLEGSGNLLRYAIGPDKHYPVVHAPIQARKVLSVAAMATGRDIYGEFSALDWRRLRVLSEAVFYMSARTEGYTMEDMAQPRPIGDPSTPANRPGTMQFRPMPGSVWSFEPRSFLLEVGRVSRKSRGMIMPDRLRRVLDEQLDTVHLHTVMGPSSHRITYSSALVGAAQSEVRESIVRGFELVKRTAAAFQAKGYTAESTVAGYVYNCMVGDSTGSAVEATWVTRAVSEVAKELGLAHAIDARLAKQVGARLTILTDDLRQKVVVEAEKHGSSLVEWWDDFASRLPMELRFAEESNQAWSAGIAWYLLAKPGARWAKLSSALANESHRALANSHLVDAVLPPVARSTMRVRAAMEVAATRLSRSYGAYYHAIADGCYLLASRIGRAGDGESSGLLRIAGRMWDIRAGATYTASLSWDDPGRKSAVRVEVDEGNVTGWIKTAPYRSYEKWRETAEGMGLKLDGYVKQVEGRVSQVFQGKSQPLMDCMGLSNTRALRYVQEPARLYRDIEKTLGEIAETLAGVGQRYASEGLDDEMPVDASDGVALATGGLDLSVFKPPSDGLWAVITQLDSHDAAWVADTLEELDDASRAELEAKRYPSGEALLMEVNARVAAAQGVRGPEAVK